MASPTDLYYKGNNAAGFSFVDADGLTIYSFETTYIRITSSTTSDNSVSIKANRSYNFAGYSKLYVEMTSDKSRTFGDVVMLRRNSEDGTIIGSTDYLEAGSNTIEFDLSRYQTTFTPYIYFSPHSAEYQITRIRIA